MRDAETAGGIGIHGGGEGSPFEADSLQLEHIVDVEQRNALEAGEADTEVLAMRTLREIEELGGVVAGTAGNVDGLFVALQKNLLPFESVFLGLNGEIAQIGERRGDI